MKKLHLPLLFHCKLIHLSTLPFIVSESPGYVFKELLQDLQILIMLHDAEFKFMELLAFCFTSDLSMTSTKRRHWSLFVH